MPNKSYAGIVWEKLEDGTEQRMQIGTRTLLCSLICMAASSASAQIDFDIQVGHHPTINLADSTYEDALDVIETELSAQCSNADVQYKGQQSLGSNVPNSFSSLDQQTLQLFRLSQTSIQIVPRIERCGKSQSSLFQKVRGCTWPGGPIVVINRGTPEKNAALWAHEMGHAQGLLHLHVTGNLMNATVDGTTWALTAAQCAAFASGQTFPPISAQFIPSPQPELGEQEEIDFKPTEFLESEWPHGIGSVLDTLIQNSEAVRSAAFDAVLRSNFEAMPNAVLTIGFLGDDGTYFIDQVLGIQGNIEESVQNESEIFLLNDARINVGYALGYQGYFGNSAARERLFDLVEPSRALEFVEAGDVRDVEFLAQEISRSALIGLVLALGSPSANEEQSEAFVSQEKQYSEFINDEDLLGQVEFSQELVVEMESVRAQLASGEISLEQLLSEAFN